MFTVDESAPPRWLLPIPDTCAGLGIGRSMLYEMAARGDVEIVRVGRRALVTVSSIEAYVDRLRAGDDTGTGDAALARPPVGRASRRLTPAAARSRPLRGGEPHDGA